MSTTVERYVIKHISGSKTNQVEEFDFTKPELTIGRAAGSSIQFDPEQETIVSREHGKILKDTADPLKFTIVDNNSRNGIFVNKTRVKGSMAVAPGDTVQLGNNGPVFTFDIYPRPQDMMMSTKIMEIPTSIKPTSISKVETADVAPPSQPVKTGLGKQTVERMLVAERKKSYSTMAFVIGGLVILLGTLGFAFKDKLFGKKETIYVGPAVDSSQLGKKTALQISAENDDKVVQIEFGWKLTDTRSNEDLWHKYDLRVDKYGNRTYVPLYIQNANGSIEPYLDVRSNVPYGTPVSLTGASGSGFLASQDGYILTNRHIGAGWNTRWDFEDFAFPGKLVQNNLIIENSYVTPDMVFGWVPANTTMVGGYSAPDGAIKGDNTYLHVVFSGTTERRLARLVQPSAEHDVALIKVDIPSPLKAVTMKDSYGKVQPGQTLTVMGYPGVAPQQVAVRSSNDPFNQEMKASTVPTPTVTPGSIGRIIPASSMKDMRFSGFGDSYQLTVNATGAGNSGGPIFDDEGNVIGIFYAYASDFQGARITFAVPIKYGLELMNVGRKVN